MRASTSGWGLVALMGLGVTGCAEPEGGVAAVTAELSEEQRVERSAVIRDVAAGQGLANGLLLAGIALAETGMAHCWSEATWACEGPDSTSCGGGPVIAGAADGPCADRQGGLGMFQFDAGDFDDTLAREGERVLTLEGNIQAAVDFVAAMVLRSSYVDGVETREQALDWMNGARVGGERYHAWLQTVTHYYNGCVPGTCSVYDSRYSHYDDAHRQVLAETGEAFWYEDVVVPTCEPLGAAGGVIEEDDVCFGAGGDPRWWNRESAGHAGGLLWTHTTDAPAEDNHCTWHLSFASGGAHRLEVYTAARFAQSAMAGYRIETADGEETVVVDQGALDGFQTLGEHRFEAGVEYTVHLADNTGEPYSTRTRIACDALRATPLAAPPEPGSEPEVDAGPPPAPADGGIGSGSDAGEPGPTASGGCSVRAGRSGAGFGLVWLALAIATRRRRGRR